MIRPGYFTNLAISQRLQLRLPISIVIEPVRELVYKLNPIRAINLLRLYSVMV